MARKLVESGRQYSQRTIYHYIENFNDLHRSSALFGTEKLTEEFIAWYIEEGKSRSPRLTNSSVQRKRLLNLFASTVHSPPVFSYEKRTGLVRSESAKESVRAFAQHLIKQNKSKETIKSYLQTANNFLHYLEKNEVKDITDTSANIIRGFIKELGTKWSPRSMRIVPSHLKTYLDYSGVNADAMLFSNLLAPKKSQPVRAMSNENVEALWKYIDGDNGDLRAKAIVIIMLVTGMRPVDITGLRLDDIDWRNDTVGFIQSKTGEYMSVKLFPAMGSAIVRYITEQRPKGTGEKHVFLTKKAPYRKLSPSCCNRILRVALEEMGIAFVADKLHCPRAVRRSLVSRMIAKGVPAQKAAASIGHVDEKSVDLYTELDIEKMKSVCLPIPTSMRGWVWAQ